MASDDEESGEQDEKDDGQAAVDPVRRADGVVVERPLRGGEDAEPTRDDGDVSRGGLHVRSSGV